MTATKPNISFRKASRADLEGALKLLDENYKGSLSPDGLQDGFISVRFSSEHLVEMADNGITVVAASDDTIRGVLSAQTCEYNLRTIPLVTEMVKAIESKILDGKAIDTSASLVCGPVCVAREFRGQGLFEKMYELLKTEARPNYPVGLTLISQGNPRSLRAHEKIGMERITSFEFDGRVFDALAMNF